MCPRGLHLVHDLDCVDCLLSVVVILVGIGDILLDDVECVGTETAIADCPNAGWGMNNCAHSEDAGVICVLNEGTTALSLK